MNAIGDKSIWNAIPIPAFIADISGSITDANVAAEHFLNVAAGRIVGRSLQGILCNDGSLMSALERACQSQGPVFLNNINLMNGVANNDASIQVAPISRGDDLLLVLVHPRRSALQMGNGDAVKAAARSAIGMAEMLAHEIKNPLAGITGAAQLLEMSLNAEDREMTELIVGECRRIVALLDQVEQFGNLRPPHREEANIHDLLDRAQRLAEVGYGAHLTFEKVYDPSLPSTFVDRDQIMQVLLNLFKNAAEAMPIDGKITLRTYYDHGLSVKGADGDTRLPLQVEVIDNGPGISGDIADQIFEPFVSGRENGTGLGLALVSKIVLDHKAWINLESAPGRTIFRLSLPVMAGTQKRGG